MIPGEAAHLICGTVGAVVVHNDDLKLFACGDQS